MTDEGRPLRVEIQRHGARFLLCVSGELTRARRHDVRVALEKCLAEQPEAVIVDLAGMTVRQPLALSVFATVARQAETWPGAAVLLCAPQESVGRLLSTGGYGRLPVFRSATAALAAEPAEGVPSVRDVLVPVAGAARHARALVADTCAQWNLPTVVPAAQVVVGELVTNAVQHAGTMMDLRVSRGRHYVLIAVRDGSTAVPRLVRGRSSDPAAGRGLMLVEEFTTHWGTFPAEGGKVVWAALPVPAARQGGYSEYPGDRRGREEPE